MTDRKLVYRIEVNTSQAKSEAKAFATQIKAELSNIKINVLDGRVFAGADAKVAKLRTELQSLAQVQSPKITIDDAPFARITERANEFKRELERVEAQAKRVGAAVEQSNRQQARRPTTPAAGGGGASSILGGANQLLGVAGISLSIAGVVSLGTELATLRKESLLATTAFNQLSGGSSQATARLNAMKQAAGGTLTTMEALRSANQITSLGMASTAEGFGRITQAARAVTFISPVIHDIGSAITELSLASANLSFRRLDQLGLSVTEVKSKMSELQEANGGLSDNQAFLEASVSTLIDKFGSLTSSAAAQATGVDKLKVAWEEFKKTLAEGDPGSLADELMRQAGTALDQFSVLVGSKSGETIASALQSAIKEADFKANQNDNTFSNTTTSFFGLTRSSSESWRDLSTELRRVLEIQQKANELVNSGAPGAAEYAAQISGITSNVANWGNASAEQIAQLEVLFASMQKSQPALTAFGAGVQGVSDAQAQAAAQAEAMTSARKSLTEAITGKATDIIGSVGSQKATELVKQQLEKVNQLIADFEARGVKGIELDIAIAANLDGLTEVFDSVEAAAQQQLGQNIAATLSDSLARGMVEANNAAFDGSAAMSGYREELAALAIEIANSGFATEEQAARVRELTGVFDAAEGSGGVFAALQNEQGQALLESNTYAADLASNIAILDAAQAAGKISAEQHAGMLSVLVGALIAVATQAGITGDALTNLKAIQAGLNVTGTPGNVAGQNAADAINAALAAQEAKRQRDEKRRADERAAREQEQAAKRAGRELESAAKRAGKALESSLQGVEGLFGLSKVSQKDLDFAAAGGNVNFADDFVRRFRDLVDNGILHDGAGVEEVKRALQNIGIKPADDIKLLLSQLETAWQNSSLFANKDNLALINKDAVQQSLDLQAKMEEGRKNIMAFFGVTIDAATGAVSAASETNVSGEELKTAVTDGQKKIADHLIATTNTAVDAATAATPTASAASATGTIQITNVTIAPEALAGLFASIAPPALMIDKVEIGPNLVQSIVTGLAIQLQAKTTDFTSQGGTLAASIEKGFVAHWTSAGTSGTNAMAQAARVAFGTQVQAMRDTFTNQGNVVAGMIKDGFTDRWTQEQQGTVLAQGFVDAFDKQRIAAADAFVEEGLIAANMVKAGFEQRLTDAQQEDTLATAFRVTFGVQVQAMGEQFRGQGNVIATFIEEGFTDHWGIGGAPGAEGGGAKSVLSEAVLGQLSTQLVAPTTTAQLEGMGGSMAGFIMWGMAGFDFSSAGSTIVNQIETAITSEASLGRLTSAGGSVADALFNGFSAQIPNADWVGVIVAAVIAQLNAGVQQTQ